MRAQHRLQLAEQMRKRAFWSEAVDIFNPLTSAQTAGTSAAEAVEHFGNGNFGKGLRAGVESIGSAAGMIPGVGFAGKGVMLGAKALGGIGKGMSWAGKGVQGFKTAPGLSNVAGGTLHHLGGRPMSGLGRLGEKVTAPLTGSPKGFKEFFTKDPAMAFQKKLLGGGRLGTAANVAPLALPLAGGAGEMAWNARPNFTKPKLPDNPSAASGYMDMARGHLQPQFNPMDAGHNQNFGG